MAIHEVLVLAMTHMLSGICTAGFTQMASDRSGLCWVRPVKEHDTLRLGDMTEASRRVVQVGDVVRLDLQKPRPQPPHTEDWVTDFIYHRPAVVRRLEGEARDHFLAAHLDRAPRDVIVDHIRSLCLVRPEAVWALFSVDPRSGEYQARLGFRLDGLPCARANSDRGIPVTDLKWRALGRTWLRESGPELRLSGSELAERLHASEFYLVLGLSRGFENEYWLMVIGVHVVPDYAVTIDYSQP